MLEIKLKENTNLNLVLDDGVPSTFEAAAIGEIFWRFDDEPEMELQFLGKAVAGKTLSVPFDLTAGRGIRLFMVSVSAKGNKSANKSSEGEQILFNPSVEQLTPAIGQIAPATNTSAQIGVNNYSEKSKYRKIEISENSDMSGASIILQEASIAVLPSEINITRSSATDAATKYIRVSHSSNNVAYSPVSNILSITFADISGIGGTTGGGWSGGGDPREIPLEEGGV